MNEVLALEAEIMAALPAADRAAGMMEWKGPLHRVIADAHDVLCNGWINMTGCTRLDRLRMVAKELRRFL